MRFELLVAAFVIGLFACGDDAEVPNVAGTHTCSLSTVNAVPPGNGLVNGSKIELTQSGGSKMKLSAWNVNLDQP
jgi:hypothetical protein